MAQPASNDGYFRLTGTAAGTVQIANNPCNLNSYTVGTTTTGTVVLYDIAGSAVGTTAATQIVSFTGAIRDAYPWLRCKKGLVAVVSGTVDALLGIG